MRREWTQFYVLVTNGHLQAHEKKIQFFSVFSINLSTENEYNLLSIKIEEPSA